MKNKQIPEKILLFVNLLAISSGLIYKLYNLSWLGVIFSLILTAISFYTLPYLFKNYNSFINDQGNLPNNDNTTNYNKFILTSYLMFAIASFVILIKSSSTQSLISPWQVIPGYFFVVYFISTLLWLKILQNNSLPFIAQIHYFLSFSIAIIIYKIGYGFDPFIHQATIELINKTGAVSPKPFYYLGQYGLETVFHKLLFIKIVWLDKLLVPLSASIIIPWLLNKYQKNNHLITAIILIIPWPIFIMTTPQNLSYLWLLIVIIIGLLPKTSINYLIMLTSAVASLITQPIAGIPALIYVIISFPEDYKLKKIINYLLIFFSIIIAPALLYISTGFGQKIIFNFNYFSNILLNIPSFTWLYKENWLLNFIYFYGFNLTIIIIVLSFIGWKINNKHKQSTLLAITAWFSYLITILLPFNYLIEYERQDYANRMLIVSTIFLIPNILSTIKWIIKKIKAQTKISKFIWLFFFSTIITFAFYLTYPRIDNYYNSRGYGVGQNEINAVRWIEKNTNEKYIVLANQQVSVAALREYGFNHYYKNDIFYYPIPTGGPLYQYYLKMVYETPSRETMISAMNLAGVNEGYFVLNKYWWAFNKILDEAKLSADNYQVINNGEIYIFKYSKYFRY